ncbi:unnamed protein product [Prorocentrum cordatum]|uniref:Uncharacterized protein n=1 Tax=Prorocentrum cordatum TaxID=2364126 RepID=A0ABN9UV18_9DINO|nr:unnamed protein product [Polarella glacialis]
MRYPMRSFGSAFGSLESCSMGEFRYEALSVSEIKRRCDEKTARKATAALEVPVSGRPAPSAMEVDVEDAAQPRAPTIISGAQRQIASRLQGTSRRAKCLAESPAVKGISTPSAVGAASPSVVPLGALQSMGIRGPSGAASASGAIGPRDSVSQVGEDEGHQRGLCPVLQSPSAELLESDPFKFK